MKLLKSLPAALAVAALTLAQPVLAQDPDNHEHDALGIPKSAEPLAFFLFVIAAAVAAGLIFEHHHPHSP